MSGAANPALGNHLFLNLGYDYFHDENLIALLNGIKETLWYYCPDTRFAQRFNLEDENWYMWGGIKYFLYEYEQHLADLKGVPVRMPWEALVQSRKEDTIEHILPQTPVDEYWTNRFPTKAEQSRWINDIGNLTLTYDNGPMQNKPFRKGFVDHDDKVSYYDDSTILIEQTLKDEAEWDAKTIQRRRDKIQDWAIQRWKVEPPDGGWEKENPSLKEIAKLPLAQKKELYFQRFMDDADRLGNGSEYRTIIDAAKKFPLYLYLNPKYMAISFNLLRHRTTWMLWLGPDLYVHVNCNEFDHEYALEPGTCAGIFGEKGRKLKHEEVPDFLDQLQRLLQIIHPAATN